MRRRVWDPASANDASNRAPEPQGAANRPDPDELTRDGIEVRAVRSVGLGRHVWIAKAQPWEQKHPIWMGVASRDQMIGWWNHTSDPRRPPPFGKLSKRLDK